MIALFTMCRQSTKFGRRPICSDAMFGGGSTPEASMFIFVDQLHERFE